MKIKVLLNFAFLVFAVNFSAIAENPIFRAADPHAVKIGDTFYVYPTSGRSNFFYVYSSTDLVNWQTHKPILDFRKIDWIPEDKSAWAPAIISKDNTCYFYYSVGPKPSHIGVATGNSPLGPFKDSGKALIADNNSPDFEAIDPMAFEDPNSGICYLYFGGSAGSKLKVFELNNNMTELAREIEVQNPPFFTEGAFMHFYNGLYYLSYSHGAWHSSSYSVHYCTAKSPIGPWDYKGPILQTNAAYKGPGHHSIVYDNAAKKWYIFYHRWENVSGDGPYRGSRKTAVENLEYDTNGLIKPVTMTP